MRRVYFITAAVCFFAAFALAMFGEGPKYIHYVGLVQLALGHLVDE